MTTQRLEIRGKIGLDSEFGYLWLEETGPFGETGDYFKPGDDFISTLFQKRFLPEHKPSGETQLNAINRLLSLSDTSDDSEQIREEVEELDRLLVDYSNRFRVVFEPLENQGTPLTLFGQIFLSGNEISFESPAVSGFLEKIFMDHYYPNQYTEIDEPEDYTEINAGLFRLTFEQIGDET